MKVNKEIPDDLLQTYREYKQKELEKWKLAQHHFKKWEESDCEDNSAYEEYQTAFNEYEGVNRVANAYARTITDWVIKEETT